MQMQQNQHNISFFISFIRFQHNKRLRKQALANVRLNEFKLAALITSYDKVFYVR